MIFCLVAVLSALACGSTSVATRTDESTQPSASTAGTPGETSVPTTVPTATTTTPKGRDSWKQPLWTNPESESDTMLVTLVSSQGQLEEGESTVIAASAINM